MHRPEDAAKIAKGECKMPLVTSKEMFQKAYEGGYAVGAFNVNNMEIIQGWQAP